VLLGIEIMEEKDITNGRRKREPIVEIEKVLDKVLIIYQMKLDSLRKPKTMEEKQIEITATLDTQIELI
jgi:hypothetical protein